MRDDPVSKPKELITKTFSVALEAVTERVLGKSLRFLLPLKKDPRRCLDLPPGITEMWGVQASDTA